MSRQFAKIRIISQQLLTNTSNAEENEENIPSPPITYEDKTRFANREERLAIERRDNDILLTERIVRPVKTPLQ